jgi:RecA-family ATPase
MRNANEFQTIDEILAEMEAADYQPYLIDGLIDSAVTTIQGDSYLGKTYLALDAANSLITGEPFLGKPVNRQVDRVAFMVTDPGGVYELARRVKSAGLDKCRIVAMSLYAPTSWDEWKEMLVRLKALGSDVVVIIDNTTDLAIDANSPREVKLITDGLRMWTEDGVAVINIHHMNKGGVYGGKSGFGSIIWQKWATAELTLRGQAKKATRTLEAVPTMLRQSISSWPLTLAVGLPSRCCRQGRR